MGKLRQTALVLGEGPTEFYYFKSLCDVFKGLTIKPDFPKHTNLTELEAKIKEGIALGYNRIFCIIDPFQGEALSRQGRKLAPAAPVRRITLAFSNSGQALSAFSGGGPVCGPEG